MNHVALVIPTIDQIGGAERQVLLLAPALAARGWRVTVIALSGSGGASARELAQAGVGFLSLGMRKAWIDPRGWLRYLEWARNNRPDIVHAHLPHAAWFARWVRLLAPVRVTIDTIHTSRAAGLGKRLGYRLSGWLTDCITCVSQAVAGSFADSRLANPSRLRVLPNGVEVKHEEISTNDTPESHYPSAGEYFRWVAVGRLAPVKNYPDMLRAFAQLPRLPRLTIAGAGPDEYTLRQLAIQLGVAERVLFVGFQHDIPALLRQADGFVLSSLWEGLPIGVLEASSAGLPVVATDGPGTREALIPGKTGLLVPVRNVAALSHAMAEVMAMPAATRLRMGSEGREMVKQSFSLEAVLDQWELLYLELLREHLNLSRRA